MVNNQFTYRQLDERLVRLGFTRQRIEPKWLRYEHAPSGTEIILVEKQATEMVRPTDAWSAREHLIRKGLIGEAELERILGSSTERHVTAAPSRQPS